MTRMTASAPGRICLFGEHQDYLGLPVIAAAINLRISIAAEPVDNSGIDLAMPDLGQIVRLEPNLEQQYDSKRDYLRSSINVLRRLGVTWPGGWSATMHGDIPINAGTSSSSAMVVAWLRFLLETGTNAPAFTDEDLARWGHKAEVTEFDEPGGMMDHYCAALGGILWVNTKEPFSAERWSARLDGIVLGNSLQDKATIETLGAVRADVSRGVDLLRAILPTFDLHATPLAEADEYLPRIDPTPARRLRANLVNRDITLQARDSIQAGNLERAGALLTAHHEQLRDGLDLSTEKIERMLAASIGAGAIGGKINGSGGGGCMFAYAPGHEEDVAEAIYREGGVPYIVRVDHGACVE